MTRGNSLPAIALPGLRPEVLGNYLASLGVLRLSAKKWATVRIAWHNGVLHVVGGPKNLDELLDHLLDIARQNRWTRYERDWAGEQKKSTASKSGEPLAVWLGKAEEALLELVAAHLIPRLRVTYNPLLGTGGNAGRRDFSEGWKRAAKAIQKQLTTPKTKQLAKEQLKAALLGEPQESLLSKLAAGSWFSHALKLYNSGQKPFREEGISPWLVVLACEGLPFFAGGASRRLGARDEVQGAFPFVTGPAAPTAPGALGRDIAELWTPLWERPMSLPEVRALFQRGRAEVRGRGARTPAAFAAAILRRGVDAGISGFARFSLVHTTSAQTFEPHYEAWIPLPGERHTPLFLPRSVAVDHVLALVERLPKDTQRGRTTRFVGLRGPIEAALVQFASTPDKPEAARNLLDAVVLTLDKVDRNRAFREKELFWEPLPMGFLPSLFGDEVPGLEATLAMALVSSFPTARPFTLYRFGVEMANKQFRHPKQPPARWVWGGGDLTRMLVRVLVRFTTDWENEEKIGAPEPRRNLFPASTFAVSRWITASLDEQLLEQWLARFALFDWTKVEPAVQATMGKLVRSQGPLAPDGRLCLYGLLQPFFDLLPLKLPHSSGEVLDPKSGARTPRVARRLIALVQSGQLDAALDLASSRYAMAGTPLVRLDTEAFLADPDRFLAALLFPVPPRERAQLVQRWLRPQRKKGGTVYV